MGRVVISGSSTVFKLSRHIAQCYLHTIAREPSKSLQQSVPRFQISSVGTTGNLSQFCRGFEDLRNASEQLTIAKFTQYCKAAYKSIDGKVVELKIARDAISIVVNRSNPAISASSLSTDQIKQILSESLRWSQVDHSWPGREILRFYPGSSSGTLHVMGDRLYGDGGSAIQSAPNLRPHENDQWAADQIVQNSNAIGYFGHAFYAEYADLLVPLPIDNIVPSAIHLGEEYPLVRDLYLYTTTDKLCENPSLRSYLRYYLASVDAYAGSLGYFPYQPQSVADVDAPTSGFPTATNLAEFDEVWQSIQQQRSGSCE